MMFSGFDDDVLWVPVSSPKSCAVSSSGGLGSEPGEEEEPVVVALPPGQRAYSTLPSVDSAVESWDGSTVDSVLNHAGTYYYIYNNDWLTPTFSPPSQDQAPYI